MAQQGFNWNQDLVDKAEHVMNALFENREKPLSYAQLRKILSIMVAIKNKIAKYKIGKNDVLNEDIVFDIKFAKTQLLYQAGRVVNGKGKYAKYPVKEFLDKSEFVYMLDSIGNNVSRFEKASKYIEALVSFYKYNDIGNTNNN